MPAASEVIVSSRIPQVVAAIEGETQRVTQKIANDIVRGCKDRSRVDTGAMQAGWQSRRGVEAKSYEVFNPVYYTVFNEYGTVNMSAQPMLAPSVEEARRAYPEEMRVVLEQIAMGPGLLREGRFTSAAAARRSGSVFTG